MMLERAQALKESAEDLHKLTDVQESIRQYTTRQEQLQAVKGQVQGASLAWSTLRAAGLVANEALPASVDAALRNVAFVHRGAQVDAGTLIKNDFSVALRNVKKASDDLTFAAREAWETYLASIEPPVPAPVLAVFERQAGLAPAASALRQVYQLHDQLRRTFPVTAEQAHKAKGLATEYDRLGADLVGTHLPPGVVTFLQAVVQGQANLAALTPEVWAWLQEHGFLPAFTVRLQ
ncbi:hypothetical protein [Deinococcus sp. LM3]|uniref:hypothetical protein n=1 Tax=Deinococcus sp. LM3 TaxID=1938608 RepID=UPI0009936531|nr:hypothetical protein [Deinococcus sp. LM3]OOV12018.1 hypothetical protein BXU09_18900 [Deinococcus sp. LM3]